MSRLFAQRRASFALVFLELCTVLASACSSGSKSSSNDSVVDSSVGGSGGAGGSTTQPDGLEAGPDPDASLGPFDAQPREDVSDARNEAIVCSDAAVMAANNNTDNPDTCTDQAPCGLGLLCGGDDCHSPWTCFAHYDLEYHPCPQNTAPYCGCDGVTFYPLDTCPDRPYEHKGACDDGFNCDPYDLLCNEPAPDCPEGTVPAVVSGAYGDCIPISACRCEFVWECPQRDKYTCDSATNRCGLPLPDGGGNDAGREMPRTDAASSD